MGCTVAYLRPVLTPALLRALTDVLPSTVIVLSEQALKIGLDLADAFPLTSGRLDAIFDMLA
jgi:hypothetical protein